MISLDKEFVDAVLATTIPSFQLTCRQTRNLGFGGIYYSFVRALRPRFVVVIGSKAGFAPIMFAKGLKDNEGYGIKQIECEETILTNPNKKPYLHFIDPSYSIERDEKNHWYGIGAWDNDEKVKALWERFELEDFVTHYRTTSQEYVTLNFENKIDLLYVDGDHSYEGMMHDFVKFHNLLADDAMVIAHDVDPAFEKQYHGEGAGGYAVYNNLSNKLYEKVRIPIYPGLSIMRKLNIK